jgi:hypothetical protein
MQQQLQASEPGATIELAPIYLLDGNTAFADVDLDAGRLLRSW